LHLGAFPAITGRTQGAGAGPREARVWKAVFDVLVSLFRNESWETWAALRL
jgi:hypothetical protein